MKTPVYIDNPNSEEKTVVGTAETAGRGRIVIHIPNEFIPLMDTDREISFSFKDEETINE